MKRMYASQVEVFHRGRKWDISISAPVLAREASRGVAVGHRGLFHHEGAIGVGKPDRDLLLSPAGCRGFYQAWRSIFGFDFRAGLSISCPALRRASTS
jgi:hypothetical protein